jgi:hypothetical protein
VITRRFGLALAAVAALLGLHACVRAPESYPVPPQHQPVGGPEEILTLGETFTSVQPDAEQYFIKDIRALENGAWRWTLVEPEMRFHLLSVTNRCLRMDIGVHEVTLRQTGPLKLEIYVNGQLLDSPVYDTPGDRRYEKPVPASMLKERAENRVLVKVLNPWQAQDPGVQLGFLLFGAGFATP